MIALQNISKTYGQTHALKNVDFSAAAGSIHAILGENGAGKSTLMRLLCGVEAPSAGTIKIDGRTVNFGNTREAASHGIACIFQELSLLPDLRVDENIVLAHSPHRFGFIPKQAWRNAQTVLARVGGQAIAPDTPVRELSLADRQLVEIAKALYQKPRILILDEATSALGVAAVEKIFSVMRHLRDQGCCIVFISHRFHEVQALADRVSVFRGGQHVRTMPMGELDRDAIVTLMVGQSMSSLFPAPRAPVAATVAPYIRLKNVSFPDELRDVSLMVRPGEIYGLGGLDGQGQQRVPQWIFGLLSGGTGTLELAGQPVAKRAPFYAKQAAQGLALVPEDRKNEGLIPALSITDNLRLAGIGVRADRRTRLARETRYHDLLTRLELVAGALSDPVDTLSGGNQQKVLLAKWLALQPRCLLLLDPTRGIDVKTKAQIYRLLDDLARTGVAIILQSTDYEELVHLCDRVAVFYNGQIARELTGNTLTPENLIAACIGLASDAHPN